VPLARLIRVGLAMAAVALATARMADDSDSAAVAADQ
jgi:hypothetical protein